MRPYWIFDRWGTMVDAIAWPIEARPTDNLDDIDTLELEVPGTSLAKGQRVVHMDRWGIWREHIVAQVEHRHEGTLTTIATCEDSRTELETDYLVEVEPGSVGAAAALTSALSTSRWDVGTVTATGTSQFSWFHKSAMEAVDEIAEALDAEIVSSITVSGAGVSKRAVDMLAHRGADLGTLLVYGANVASVERVVSNDPIYTALYGYGKSLETEGGGHSRKLTFGSANGGQDWVGDEAARERYGVPDRSGAKRHAFGDVEFSDCDDPSELLTLTKKQLERVSKPQVSYTVNIAYLDRYPHIGDTVHVRDRELDERLSTRVLKIEGDDLDESNTRITLGTTRPTLTSKLKSTQQAADKAQSGVDELTDRAFDWDSTTDTVDKAPGEWLRKVMDRINQEMESAKTYKFTSFEKGDIWANGPLTEEGKPTGDTSAAIALNGLGFRISSEVKGGEFVWTTFGTGAGFTANCINVGILRCGQNYLNLDTGEMRLALTTATVDGGQSLSNYVSGTANSAASSAANSAVSQANRYTDQQFAEADFVSGNNFDSFLNMRNVFNALTNGGQNKGFFIQGGNVYVSADALQTGMILSSDGSSGWDLDSGYFETSSSGYSGGQFHGITTRLYHGSLIFRMDVTDIGSLATYSNGGAHPLGIKCQSDLVLGAPRNLGVSYNSSLDGSLTYETAAREAYITIVTDVKKDGDNITSTKRKLTFRHGILIKEESVIALDPTFSTPLMDHATLAASVQPADEVEVGGAIPIERIGDTPQMMAAAEGDRMIWQMDPETMQLGIPVYTGELWTMGVPVQDEGGE